MILVNTPTLPDRKIKETLGIARGSTVRARNIGRDIFAGLKNIVGGEISEYTKLQAESREQALQRMIEDAERMGANAVVNVRLTTSMVMQGCSEILAYGTAVIVDSMEFFIYILGGGLLIYLIVNRANEKDKENFEDRDN